MKSFLSALSLIGALYASNSLYSSNAYADGVACDPKKEACTEDGRPGMVVPLDDYIDFLGSKSAPKICVTPELGKAGKKGKPDVTMGPIHVLKDKKPVTKKPVAKKPVVKPLPKKKGKLPTLVFKDPKIVGGEPEIDVPGPSVVYDPDSDIYVPYAGEPDYSGGKDYDDDIIKDSLEESIRKEHEERARKMFEKTPAGPESMVTPESKPRIEIVLPASRPSPATLPAVKVPESIPVLTLPKPVPVPPPGMSDFPFIIGDDDIIEEEDVPVKTSKVAKLPKKFEMRTLGDGHVSLAGGMWMDYLDGEPFSNGQILTLAGRVPLVKAKGLGIVLNGDLSGILGEYRREGHFKALDAELGLLAEYARKIGSVRLSAGIGVVVDFLQAFDKYVDGTTVGIRELAASPVLRLTADTEWISVGATGSFGSGMSGNSFQGYDPLLRTKIDLDLILHLGKFADAYARNEVTYDALKVGTKTDAPDIDRSHVDYVLKVGGVVYPVHNFGVGLEGELNLHESAKNKAPLFGGKVKVEYRF